MLNPERVERYREDGLILVETVFGRDTIPHPAEFQLYDGV